MVKKIVKGIAVAGIVFNKNKVLIIQRSENDDVFPGLWELPSGKRENFEKSEDALVREVKEETNLDVIKIDPIHVFEFKVDKEEEIRDVTQISFLVELIGKPIVKLSEEHQNFVWVIEDQLSDYNVSKESKKAISKAFEYMKRV
jgi:ADP-ribose pyrophosphatase